MAEKNVPFILIESECFDLEFIQKCCLDEIGSGRADRYAQGEDNGHVTWMDVFIDQLD